MKLSQMAIKLRFILTWKLQEKKKIRTKKIISIFFLQILKNCNFYMQQYNFKNIYMDYMDIFYVGLDEEFVL